MSNSSPCWSILLSYVIMTLKITGVEAKPLEIKLVAMSYGKPLTKHEVLSGVDEQSINRSLRAQQPNASSEMFGITSLPVWERLWSYPTLSEPAIMVCTNVLVLKSKHSQSCYLLSLFPFAQKFCLSFSKVPLSMVRRDRFHKACYCVSGSWDCFVAEIDVMFLVCMRLDTRTHMRTRVYIKRYLWKYYILSGFRMDCQVEVE